MAEAVLRIEGMSCGHCVDRVRRALEGLDGLKAAEVEVGRARVSYDEAVLGLDRMAEAVAGAGYKVVERGPA